MISIFCRMNLFANLYNKVWKIFLTNELCASLMSFWKLSSFNFQSTDPTTFSVDTCGKEHVASLFTSTLRKIAGEALCLEGMQQERKMKSSRADFLKEKSHFVVEFSSVWLGKFFAPSDSGVMLIKARFCLK